MYVCMYVSYLMDGQSEEVTEKWMDQTDIYEMRRLLQEKVHYLEDAQTELEGQIVLGVTVSATFAKGHSLTESEFCPRFVQVTRNSQNLTGWSMRSSLKVTNLGPGQNETSGKRSPGVGFHL